MTLQDYQNQVDEWIQEYGVRYFNELTNTLILHEEVGEFSRLMARQFGEQSFKKDKSAGEIQLAIEDELADILFVVTCLANQMGINLEEAVERNFVKKTNRDSTRHKENRKLGN